MNKPFYTLTIDGEDYRLCLPAAEVAQLEEKLGKGLIAIVSDQEAMQKVTTQATILHAAMQRYQHGTKMADAYELYDAIISREDGKGMEDIVNVIVEVLKSAGFIPQSAAVETKMADGNADKPGREKKTSVKDD